MTSDNQNKQRTINVSVPGRICLFGEHQDYLKLPVITAAIDLRINLRGKANDSGKIKINLPDISETEELELTAPDVELAYQKERDYFRSGFNVVMRTGIELLHGCEVTISGNIPINSGTSSSSALTVAWIRFLLEASGQKSPRLLEDESIAKLAHLAEVVEFGEPGGMMDHFATAMGGILYQDFENEVVTEKLPVELGHFVLGDSQSPKDTKGILSRVKQGVLDAVKIIRESDPGFYLKSVSPEALRYYESLVTPVQYEVLQGAILNRDLTREARNLFLSDSFNAQELGQLMNEHQEVLDKKLQISTPKINKMLRSAMDAGALGGKINGSGGGGCMFVYVPERTHEVARAIEAEGGIAYIVQVDSGITVY